MSDACRSRPAALLLVAMTGVWASVAGAQTTPSPVEVSTVEAGLMPGDSIPPPRNAPAAGGGPRRGPVQAPVAPGPSLALALEAAQAAIAACASDGLKVGVSVIDSSGQPRAMLTGEGTTGNHLYTGVRKALASLAFKLPGSQIAARLKEDPSADQLLKPNMRPMSGSVPLLVGSTAVGAIGVSGATSTQDEKCAAAGAEKIQGRLQAGAGG